MKKECKSIGKYCLMYSIVLIYLELILRLQIDGSIGGAFLFFICFVPAEAVFLTLCSGIWKDGKNIVLSLLLILLLVFYYTAQLIYYKNFGSLFSAHMMRMGTEAVGNFSWTIKGVIWENLKTIVLLFLPIRLVGSLSFLPGLKQEKIQNKARLILAASVIPLWLLGIQLTRLDGMELQSAYRIYYDALSDTDSTAAHLGALTTTILEFGIGRPENETDRTELLADIDMELLTNAGSSEPEESHEIPALPSSDSEEHVTFIRPQILEAINLSELAAGETNAGLRELSLYLEKRGATETNEYTGIFEGCNLIYICAEAFCPYAIDERVTPTLAEMAGHGIVLNHYYNSFRNTTTNGEFALATGLWPDLSMRADEGTGVGSFPQSAKRYMPMGLGTLFRGMGVPAYGYHNYYGEYYRRNLSWPNLGYTCKFYKDGMDFTSIWPASDLELMEQSVDDYIGEERFHAYYMTFSGHGPYAGYNSICRKNIAYVREHAEEGKTEEAYYYLAGQYELDRAMEYLLERLEKEGKLENTVIVLAGDHYPYNLSAEAAEQLAGHPVDTDFEMYQSVCIIYNAGIEEAIVSDTYCSNVDILPTILNLFGIEFDARLVMGRDIFAEGVHKAVLYNKSFITDLVRYNRRTGEAVWSERAENYTDEMKKEYLNTMIEFVNSEYYASTQIMNLNYYRYLWYNSGLLTEEELAAEKERAEQAESESLQMDIKQREQESREAENREAESREAENGGTENEQAETGHAVAEQAEAGQPAG